MSIYDHRDHSEIPPDSPNVPDKWATNRHILSWWTVEHDHTLEALIRNWHWSWYLKASDAIVAITPAAAIEKWRKRDSLCRRYAWYNVLMGFCQARAQVLELTRLIRRPESRLCLDCGQTFIEDTLPLPLVERLGIDRLAFCSPCLRDALFGNGRADATREEVVEFARGLADAAGRVPIDGFGNHIGDLDACDDQTRLKLFSLLKRKPTKEVMSTMFGKWFDVLVAAGVLQDGARQTARGTQCRARDGHMCYSLGEKTIDDLLYQRGIPHEKEPHYPNSNMRADFNVRGIFVEYWGLAGNASYDEKTKLKLSISKAHQIEVISIYPKDVCSGSALLRKLGSILTSDDGQPVSA